MQAQNALKYLTTLDDDSLHAMWQAAYNQIYYINSEDMSPDERALEQYMSIIEAECDRRYEPVPESHKDAGLS